MENFGVVSLLVTFKCFLYSFSFCGGALYTPGFTVLPLRVCPRASLRVAIHFLFNFCMNLRGRNYKKLSWGGGGGVSKFLLERRITLKKKGGGGVNVEMGVCHFFYYFTIQLHLLYACRKSKVSFITFQSFSLLSEPWKILIHVFIVLKHCIICTFLIHSDYRNC